MGRLCFSKKGKEGEGEKEEDDKKAEMPPQKAVEAIVEKHQIVFQQGVFSRYRRQREEEKSDARKEDR